MHGRKLSDLPIEWLFCLHVDQALDDDELAAMLRQDSPRARTTWPPACARRRSREGRRADSVCSEHSSGDGDSTSQRALDELQAGIPLAIWPPEHHSSVAE